MVPVGHRPILWHLMKYYAHFGHKDFILCLGHQGTAIKEYFLNYNECLTNNFVMRRGGAEVELLSSDIDDWSITFVDTGARASIGQRLKAVEPYLAGEETFLANYADGLTDVPLTRLVDFHRQNAAVATFLAVPPTASFHAVEVDPRGRVEQLMPVDRADMWMNGGYFVLQHEIFDYLHHGEELVLEPFARLISEGRLCCLKHRGFWSCMDTYKEKQQLDEMHATGNTPWVVWNQDTVSEPSKPPSPELSNGRNQVKIQRRHITDRRIVGHA
jgi:glucose-1-phosphate cytidylyltransferase